MDGDASPGGVARATRTREAPLVESRFRYRVRGLDGEQVGRLERERVIELDEVLEVEGERWRVVSTVGASATVSRTGDDEAMVSGVLLPPPVGRRKPSRFPTVQVFGYVLMIALCLVTGWALIALS
jgi:hypothetical protein